MRPVRGFPNRDVKEFVKVVSWSSRIQRLYAWNDGKSATDRSFGATEDGDPASLGIEDGVDGSARMSQQRP